MEYAAMHAADLGYDRILPPHCFLALLGETEGVAEAFRLADRKVDPIELNRNGIGEATVELLTAAQKAASLWNSEKIDTPHLLSVLLDEQHMPPRLASVLQSSPLNLDLERMRRHLDEYLREARKHTRREIPFRLPVSLLPSEDLTYLARTEGLPEAVLPQKKKKDEEVPDLYDAMTRALYRQANNHVLITGLRGVGKTTMIWELARRAAAGQIPYLKRKRFLWVDCQDVSPQESKDKLEGLLAQVAGRTDLLFSAWMDSGHCYGPNREEITSFYYVVPSKGIEYS